MFGIIKVLKDDGIYTTLMAISQMLRLVVSKPKQWQLLRPEMLSTAFIDWIYVDIQGIYFLKHFFIFYKIESCFNFFKI